MQDIFNNVSFLVPLLQIFWHSGSDFTLNTLVVKPCSALIWRALHFTSSPDIFNNVSFLVPLLQIFWHSGSDFTLNTLVVKPCSALIWRASTFKTRENEKPALHIFVHAAFLFSHTVLMLPLIPSIEHRCQHLFEFYDCGSDATFAGSTKAVCFNDATSFQVFMHTFTNCSGSMSVND